MMKRDTILIVDDMEVNRAILHGVFETQYNLLEAENGEQALLLLEAYHGQIAALLLDLMMPVMNGYQVMEEMRERGEFTDVPVVVITAEDSVEHEVRAFDLGASDIVKKPFEPHVVKRRIQNIIELNLHRLNQEELIAEQAARLRESNAVMIDALSSIIEYRSVETGQHIQRIRMFAKVLLEDVSRCYAEYGLNERNIDMIASASSMHDIGKIAIPDSILNKPGRLTPEEFEIMKTHSVKGCEILAGLDRMSDQEYLQYAYNICRYHHERWDGSGYPDGLKGDSIPVCAQVVGIADCYDALTTDRVYRKALPAGQAVNMILNGECGAFSPKLLECLKNVQEPFKRLSQEYADGTSARKDYIHPTRAGYHREQDPLDTLQMGQMKYFSLLKYTDSTVMEVDMTNGVYHVVYMPDSAFELLRSGSSFAESVANFADALVHPDDRGLVKKLSGRYMEAFFENGLTRRSYRFRVFNPLTEKYRWCQITLLRIDCGQPHQCSALVIWQPETESAAPLKVMEPAGTGLLHNLVGGIQQCLNDRWFTLVQVNEGFMQMLGYGDQELRSKFQNRFLNLIYPADREEVLRQTKEQLQSGSTVELEYRVVARDQRIVWVLDKSQLTVGEDGKESLFSILIDITRSKKAQDELRLTLERHKIIMDQTNDVIFEWDIGKDQLSYSPNWVEKFGYVPITEQASKRMVQVSHIHPEDMPMIDKLVKRIRAGQVYGEAQFRLADAKGRYRWCKIRTSTQFDDMGNTYKAVGVMTDIDEEKRAAQALIDKADRDELTGLYNKSAVRRKMEDYLQRRPKDESAVVYIIDVDNFKQINDGHGHMFGDTVLQAISAKLREVFRGQDLIARIGGDEFLVFVRGMPDPAAAERRAMTIRDGVGGLFRQNVIQCNVSCSIGIARCPENGTTFDELFQRGDMALYYSKAKGKDRFALYDQEQMSRLFDGNGSYRTANTTIDPRETTDIVTGDVMEQVFRLLCDADDIQKAVQHILDMLGRQFAVSRASIYELSPDGGLISNAFEWCNEGVESRSGREQRKCDGRLIRAVHAEFDDGGVWHCPDISALKEPMRRYFERRGTKSMLQCEISDRGIYRGAIVFEDCAMIRIWTEEQIHLLAFVAKLLSVFLIKERARCQAAEDGAGRETVAESVKESGSETISGSSGPEV